MTEQATSGTADEQQPQFSLQRIYLRDPSFESLGSPEIFRQEWNPPISLDLNTRQKQLDGDFYEVALIVSVTVKNDEDTTAFIAEAQQVSISLIKDLDPSGMSHTLGAFYPGILSPYVCETLDNLVIHGSFPVLMPLPVNSDVLYAQEIARMQASGEIPTPSVQQAQRL